jgi:hypothetical protein
MTSKLLKIVYKKILFLRKKIIRAFKIEVIVVKGKKKRRFFEKFFGIKVGIF